MVSSFLGGHLATFPLGSGHERAPVLLLVLLLVRTVRGTLTGVLVLPRFAFGAIKNRSDRLLTRGMAGGNVEELLGNSRALVSQLVNQGLVGGPGQERSYNIGVGDVRQLVALLGEVLDVPTKSFPDLLSIVFEIPWVPRTRVCALEVSHEDLF